MGANGHTALFHQLEHVRKQRDWSYQELSEHIATVTERTRDQDSLRRLCQGLVTKPNSRTVDIVEEFLSVVKAPPKRRRPAKVHADAVRRPATRRSA